MQFFRSISGAGLLAVRGVQEPVGYHIHFVKSPDQIAEGIVIGWADHIAGALSAPDAKLTLVDGTAVDVLVLSTNGAAPLSSGVISIVRRDPEAKDITAPS